MTLNLHRPREIEWNFRVRIVYSDFLTELQNTVAAVIRQLTIIGTADGPNPLIETLTTGSSLPGIRKPDIRILKIRRGLEGEFASG